MPQAFSVGPVELTYATPVHCDLTNGLACVFTARPMDANRIELVSVLEKSGRRIASSRTAPVMLHQALELTLGGVHLRFIPEIKSP